MASSAVVAEVCRLADSEVGSDGEAGGGVGGEQGPCSGVLPVDGGSSSRRSAKVPSANFFRAALKTLRSRAQLDGQVLIGSIDRDLARWSLEEVAMLASP